MVRLKPETMSAAVRQREGTGMLVQLLVGSAVSALNIVVHALVTMAAIRIARAAARRNTETARSEL
jgi:hypothetical protein